jgi:ferredoxin
LYDTGVICLGINQQGCRADDQEDMGKGGVGVFIKRSTRDFFKAWQKVKGATLFDRLHGYVYARWPYLYLGIGLGEHPVSRPLSSMISILSRTSSTKDKSVPLGKTFADTYHGKVVTTDSARQLVQVQEDINLPDLEHVIPYPKARDIIMINPDHIVILDCPCRSARPDPCLPLDVCMIVGEPFASFILGHHPDRSRRVTREQAEGILEAEHARGHVHHAFFKDAMLGRFYAICNCCSCCCGAMHSMRNGTPMLASSGYVSEVELDLCVACGLCTEHCPFGAMRLDNARLEIDRGLCMGCGVCVSTCPEGALSLQEDPEKGVPLVISELLKAGAEA